MSPRNALVGLFWGIVFSSIILALLACWIFVQ